MSKIISPDGEICPTTPNDITEMQFYLDHPSLLEQGKRPVGEDWTRLHQDIERCRELLAKSKRKNIALIGAGSYGVVFRCFDEEAKRNVAIKILRPSYYLSPRVRSRFSLEAESLSKCELPGIIRVLDYAEVDGAPYIVTEYVDGPNLAQYFSKREHAIPARLAIKWVITIAHAIQGMHERGFIHRDLKPTNILLATDESDTKNSLRPIITDFGLVKEITGPLAPHSASGESVGTFEYMAPEQVLGHAEKVSIKTDIHAIGVTLFELLTGEKPYAAKGKVNTLLQLTREPARSIRGLKPELSRTLEAIVHKCLEKLPDRRYASAQELASDLEAYLENKPTIARPVSVFQRVWYAARQNKILTSLWLLLVGSLITIAFLYQRQSSAFRVADSSMKLAVDSFHEIQAQAESKWNVPGKMEDRLFLQQMAFEKFEKLAKQRKYDAFSRYKLSIAYHYLASAEITVERRANAIAHRREGIALLEQLALEEPNNAKYRFDLFRNHMLLGESLAGMTGMKEYELACREIEALCVTEPGNATFLDARNSIYMTLVRHLRTASPHKDEARALRLLESAMASSNLLAIRYPDQVSYGRYVSQGHLHLMGIKAGYGDWKEVKRHYQLALEANAKIAEKFANRGDWLQEEWIIRITVIELLRNNGRDEEMIKEIRACLPVQDSLEKWYPEQQGRIWAHAETKLFLAMALAKSGEREEARKWLSEAKADCERAKIPENFEARQALIMLTRAKAEAAVQGH